MKRLLPLFIYFAFLNFSPTNCQSPERGITLPISEQNAIDLEFGYNGYSYLAEEDNFILYFTDSDDGRHRMRQFYVAWNDDSELWEIQNLYSDYHLDYAISLARN